MANTISPRLAPNHPPALGIVPPHIEGRVQFNRFQPESLETDSNRHTFLIGEAGNNGRVRIFVETLFGPRRDEFTVEALGYLRPRLDEVERRDNWSVGMRRPMTLAELEGLNLALTRYQAETPGHQESYRKFNATVREAIAAMSPR